MLKEAGRKCGALKNERAVGRETDTNNCSAEMNIAPDNSVHKIDCCVDCQVNSGDISGGYGVIKYYRRLEGDRILLSAQCL